MTSSLYWPSPVSRTSGLSFLVSALGCCFELITWDPLPRWRLWRGIAPFTIYHPFKNTLSFAAPAGLGQPPNPDNQKEGGTWTLTSPTHGVYLIAPPPFR